MILAAATLTATGLVGWHHVAWPLLLKRVARPAAAPPPVSILPSIAIVMPAHDEAAIVAQKLRNLAALDYPPGLLRVILACDGCSDATVAIARATLAEPGCAHLRAEVRDLQPNRGKLAVLNETVAGVTETVVVMSDVSALLPRDALRQAAAHFADPGLGAVGGTYLLDAPGSAGEAKYWAYQRAVKQGEATLGAPLGMHGAFWAFRRKAFEPLPPDTINDDFILPMRMYLAGWRLAYDTSIGVREAEQSDTAMEVRRRRRIAAGNAQQLMRLLPVLHPRHGGVALAFASGKALRVLMPFLILASFLGAFALTPESWFFTALAGCEALGMGLAALGLLLGEKAPKTLAIGGYVLAGHAASAVGVVRYLLRQERRPWRRAGSPAAA